MAQSRGHRRVDTATDRQTRWATSLCGYRHRDRIVSPVALAPSSSADRRLSSFSLEPDGRGSSLPRSHHAVTTACDSGDQAAGASCVTGPWRSDHRQYGFESLWSRGMAQPETRREEAQAREETAYWDR